MTMTIEKIMIAMAIATLVFGCDKTDVNALGFADLHDSDAVVTLNGKKLTWGEIRHRLDYEYRLFVLKNRKNGLEPTGDEVMEFRPTRLKSLIAELANAELFEQQIEKDGVSASEKTIQVIRQDFLEGFRSHNVTSVVQVASLLGVPVAYIEDLIKKDADRREYLIRKDPLIEFVPPEEIAKRKERISAYNVRCATSNELQWAKLEHVKKEIDAGLDFAEAAEKYGECKKHHARRWMNGTYEDLIKEAAEKEPKLADWAFSAPVGSVGGPFAMTDGYSLVKIVTRREGAKFMVEGANLGLVNMVRMTVNAFKMIPDKSDALFAADLSDYRERKGIKRELDSLWSCAKVDYPCGTNLFQRLPIDLTASTPVLSKEK